MAPANTGNDNNNKNAVINTDHTYKGICNNVIPRILILNIVTIKLIAPAIDEIPAKCKLNIAKSIEAPLCATTPANGGYTVHPVPAPTSTKLELSNKHNEGGNNQKLKLFNLGKAISGAPIIIGINQLPNPPIKIGITIKKNHYKCMCCYNNII
jgi:hypothetical protein